MGAALRLDASRETQTFGTTASAQTRTRVAMTFARWMTDRTRVTAGAGVERWTDRPGDATLSYGIEHWRFDDRVRLSAAIAQAIGSAPFTAGSVAAAARTKASYQGLVLLWRRWLRGRVRRIATVDLARRRHRSRQ